MDDPQVYLSVGGEEHILPLSQARIPVLDRGFIFGDGIYEVVPVYRGVPFRLAQHLARLARSMAAIDLVNPFDTDGWKTRIATLIANAPASDQIIYMQVTRGVAKRAHAFPQNAVPTVFMMPAVLSLPGPDARRAGVAVVTAPDNRWLRCDIKSTSLLGNVLMAQHAAEAGVAETVMFRDGYLTEGSSSNVWIVKNGVLKAPPRNERILEGIRYGFIAELAAVHQVPIEIGPISESEVHDADEIMLSSASKEVLAVVRIDQKIVGSGIPGPVYAHFYDWYQNAKAESQKAARLGVREPA